MTRTAIETQAREEPDRHFADPLKVANMDDVDYLVRLDILQTWLARVSEGTAVKGTREDIEGAILALQARAKLDLDAPEDQPSTTTYGGVERSNLKDYSLRRFIERVRGAFGR